MSWFGTAGGTCALRLAVAAGVAIAAAGSRPAQASIIKFAQIEELARSSSMVVRARITDESVHWTEDRQGIYTLVEAVVLGDVAAHPGREVPAGRRLTIVQAGGEIDGVSLDWVGRPTFEVGEDLVLFLQPYDPKDRSDQRLLVVGGKQGRMRVVEGPGGEPAGVERNLMGVRGAPALSGDLPEGPAPRKDLVPYDELRRRVRGTPAAGPAGSGR
ncbi:MAG TPA: hypothetical protein VJV23_00380 [Candidatus Polarisedimenticolia bacterium]|nr:hypothetical protein [Candidatus Polarisedimenticolia bacterium]